MHNYYSHTLFFVFILATVAAGAAFVGQLFTEKLRPLLPFKPFNCRPCLTFHLTWLFMGAIVLCFNRQSVPIDGGNALWIMLCIVLTAFLNFFIAKQNQKIFP